VFFSSRDALNRSRIGYVTIDLSRPRDGVEVCGSPVLEPGRLGTFDDAGVTTSCAINWSGRLFFFYTGWSLGVTVPFYLSVGLATSDDGGQSLKRWSAAPLFDRSDVDPYLTASPWVLIEGELWRMDTDRRCPSSSLSHQVRRVPGRARVGPGRSGVHRLRVSR
jgi:hypothetical protein